jgi:hypothetical protein
MADIQKVTTRTDEESTVSSLFAWRKSERIASAMYLISSFMADETLLRDHLREASLRLVSESLSLRMSLQSADVSIKLLLATIYRLQSLIHVGNTCGLVSDMNARILERELDELAIFLASYPRSAGETDVSLTADFFVSSGGPAKKSLGIRQLSSSSGDSSTVFRTPGKGNDIEKKQAYERSSASRGSSLSTTRKKKGEEHNSRRRAILTLLAEQSSVTINDVGAVVRSCSGKTLQRELLAMVQDGILKKHGQKRWSVYSLAK